MIDQRSLKFFLNYPAECTKRENRNIILYVSKPMLSKTDKYND